VHSYQDVCEVAAILVCGKRNDPVTLVTRRLWHKIDFA
jgi:hypothetical protein